MTRFLLTVDYSGGVVEAPMTEWAPDDVRAHLDYYEALNEELADSGELIAANALTGPELAKVVTSDGSSTRVITDGPFAESKELLAGYELVDVESEERAVEIAARFSCVPGPGGMPLQQPIGVRRLMDVSDFELLRPEL
ncbi:MAG TPA: YciI family protein [Actinomycetes bacterium]|nr:YciI family protein [Actinomycetes bacterium]